MHHCLALDTRHLLCYYVLSGATPAGTQPHMQTELQTQAQRSGLKNVPDLQVNTGSPHRQGTKTGRPSSSVRHGKVTGGVTHMASQIVPSFSSEKVPVSGTVEGLGPRTTIHLFTNADAGFYFLLISHAIMSVKNWPVHRLKTVRGNAALQAKSQRHRLDNVPDK